MGRTELGGRQIKDHSVQNVDLDITTTGLAVITKLQAGTNITLDSTGIDDGTGVVTINSNSSSKTWIEKSANYSISIGEAILLDSTSSSFTITLPASPNSGDTVYLLDKAGQCETNNVTIARNGKVIMELAEDMLIDVNNSYVTLTFSDNTKGWRVY